MTNPVEGGMSRGLEACEEAIKVPEGRWGWGWHRRWRLEVQKIGLLTTGLGRADEAEAKIMMLGFLV